MMLLESKTGNGAFEVHIMNRRTVQLSIDGGPAHTFSDAHFAYDYCVSGYSDLQGTMRGYSYLNAAHALQDFFDADS
jgi:hypothetical protein